MKHVERSCLTSTSVPYTEKRVENTTRSGVFLRKFEMFGNMLKHCIKCLLYLLNRNLNYKGENEDVIYQTRDTVLHQDIQTLTRELRIRRIAEHF